MSASKPKIRAILSDWGRVVVDFDNRKTARALAPYTRSYLASQIHDIMFVELREIFDAYMRGQISTGGFRRTMMRALDLVCDDDAFDRAFADVFTPNQPIIDLWKDLRARGLKLVSASNVEELRHKRLIEMGIHDLFDGHCLSYQVGVGKPDEAFYAAAWKAVYLDSFQILFVDDHPENVEAARRRLMTGYVYDLKDHAAFLKFLEGFELAPYQMT